MAALVGGGVWSSGVAWRTDGGERRAEAEGSHKSGTGAGRAEEKQAACGGQGRED